MPEKPDGRASGCKPGADVCLQAGSIPVSGISGVWGVATGRSPKLKLQVRVPVLPSTFRGVAELAIALVR